MKKLLLTMALMLTSLASMAADTKQQFVPSSYGGWLNLSASVNDITCYTSDPLPMQAAVSGKTVHVFWADWKPNAQGEYCIYYRRSTDAGKTWEDARAIVKSKNMSTTDINYVGGSLGSNSKWFNVDGKNVQVVTVLKSDDGQNSELLLTYSTNSGKSFKQRVLAKGNGKGIDGEGHYYYGRPHVVSDGQTLVIAFQHSRYNGTSYKTRVFTSFDGGSTFKDKEIDKVQDLVDVQVSGKRWAVLGNDMYWNYNMWWGNVYFSTSTDGGETVTTQNIAPLVKDDTSWCELTYMKGFNGASFNYHPQMTLEGNTINVIFRGCAKEKEDTHPTYDRAHTIFRRSTNGGKTWTDAMYIPETTGTEGAIAAKGKHIYVLQNPNGPRIHYSHDGGKTWKKQERCYWTGRYDGYSNFYELYIAPDDDTGQHVYLTGCRALLVESKDGFRSVERTFSLGTESFYGGRTNNHSLTVLMDSEGTEHWFMNYQAPYKNFDPYFWNVVYRRNDPAPATTGTEMALDISKKVYSELTGKIVNDITIPMTPSLMATQEATTVECWVRVDETDYSFEVASVTNSTASHAGSRYSGGWFIHADKSGDYYSFYAALSTELSVDGVGKQVSDRSRYKIKVNDKGYWHHVAMTYDSKQEKDNLRLYIDGVLIDKATEKGKIVIGNNPIVIGRTSTYGDNQKALVDNFAIWSRALTQEEIQAHLYNTPDANDEDCRLLLTFDGSLQDQSQYHNDPAPLMDAVLTKHTAIKAPHPAFAMAKETNGQKVNVSDMTQDGVGCWWVLPYPGRSDDYKTSEQRHVSQDFSRDPGTYTYTLVAKGTGKYNAYASTSQTITIGGLSRVYPEVAGQFPSVKLHILGGYKLTYKNQPKVVLKKGKTEIEGQWEVDYDYDYSKIVSPDDVAPAAFNLWDAPLGKYDVIVGTDTLKQAFTLKAREEPDLWMKVNSREKILWNKYLRFTIDYGNKANVAAYNTPMFLCIPNRKGTVDVKFEFDFDLCNDAVEESYQKMAQQQLGDYLMAYDEQTGDSVRIYSFFIPYIGPNSNNQLAFRLKAKNEASSLSDDMCIYFWLDEPWGPCTDDEDVVSTRAGNGDELDRYIDEVNKGRSMAECALTMLGLSLLENGVTVIPVVGCAWNAVKTGSLVIWGREKGINKLKTFGCNLLTTAFSCGSDLFPPSLLVKGGYVVASTIWDMVSNKDAYDACLRGDPDWRKNTFVGSLDPNEMIGPWGYDDQAHYIKPIKQMGYTITFENKSSATAPAHEVFVTDVLDKKKYDLSTFSFTGFGWAENSYTVGGSKTTEFSRDISYNVKGQDILVRVSGQFDKSTGTIRWSFVSLKKNGDEIDDPDLGFLLPNNANGVGEGFVSFIVEHKANPANASTIKNKATIVFDANDPIVTNTYVNTFDTDYPTSKITKVTEKKGKLTVTVSGSDATSGIGAYRIYAFKNNGPAEMVAAITSGKTATFACDAGTKYGLCVIATDNVGWFEAKDLKPEVEVSTTGTGISTILMDDPENNEFIDLQGRHVKEPTAPGIYIQNGKKVLIKKLIQDESE